MAGHRIFPHGDFKELAPNLWQVTGSLPFPLPRNMTIYRRPNGELLLYSVVALEEAAMQRLEKFGKPAWMVVPHPMHTMDASFYTKRYPELRVVAPADAKKSLGEMKVHYDVDAGMAELGMRHHVVPGMKYSEVVLDLDVGAGRALVFTDLLGQGRPKGLLMRLLGPPGGSGIARIVRLRQLADKSAVRGFLERVADTPDLSLIATAHTPPITEDAPGMLRRSATQLA
jgi:hypothetical protein